MNVKKITLILLILSIVILSIGAVAASDDINATQATEPEIHQESQDNNAISLSESTPTTTDNSNYNPQNIDDESPKYTEVKLSAKPLKTTYKSTDTLNVKVGSKYDITYGVKDAMGLKNSLITLKIKVNGKWKEFKKFADAKGIARFKLTSLPVGTYAVKMYCNDQNFHSSIYTTTLKIIPAKPTLTAYPAVYEYHKNGIFKIFVKDKNRKPIVGIKLKVKVHTGKKIKTYNVKTNRYGVATLNTKKIGIGAHRVDIVNGDKNSRISKRSKIFIGTKKVLFLKMNKQLDFKNGDYFWAHVVKRDGQDPKGVYVDNRRVFNGNLDGALSHHVVKAKYYFKNTKTGKIKTKISTSQNMMHSDLIDGYTPIKVKIWYIKS